MNQIPQSQCTSFPAYLRCQSSSYRVFKPSSIPILQSRSRSRTINSPPRLAFCLEEQVNGLGFALRISVLRPGMPPFTLCEKQFLYRAARQFPSLFLFYSSMYVGSANVVVVVEGNRRCTNECEEYQRAKNMNGGWTKDCRPGMMAWWWFGRGVEVQALRSHASPSLPFRSTPMPPARTVILAS